MRKLLRILTLLFLPLLAGATHQVSGYIKFDHISGTTYRVTLVSFTNGDSITSGNCNTLADRDTMRMFWGDGTSDVLVRYNSNGPTLDHNGYPGGQGICPCRKMNLYSGVHQFPGPGSYHMWIDDADRMFNIVNIPNSGNDDFYLFTTLNISPFFGDSVSTPIITHPLVCEYACTGQCYYYNLGAYSTVGDSISYSLGNCLVLGGQTAPGYFIPAGASIDPVSGTLAWCNPSAPGIYNFSIRIISYKHIVVPGDPPTWRAIDTMDVELELIVSGNCVVHDPKITGPSDTCVIAGQILKLNYTATDPDVFFLTMSAAGQPFSSNPQASFTSNTAAHLIKGTFVWQTNCTEVRNAPYQITVKATDPGNGTTILNAYQTTNIHVIGPPITDLKAAVAGNSVKLTWDPSTCKQTVGYNIYRAIGCDKYTPGPCQTGVPPSSGYIYIGSTAGWSNVTFTDSTVVPGLYYSYIVDAVYPAIAGSAQSIASNDTCVFIRRDIPLLTNVSVDSTASGTGRIYVRWIKPKSDALDFDTTTFTGPYTYLLSRATGINGTSYTQVAKRTYPYFGSSTDTTFKDVSLNTSGTGYRYRLNFFYHDSLSVGTSPEASSIFLTAKPSNNLIDLSWKSVVPWTDSAYMIYRMPPLATSYTYLTTVKGNIHTYTDTALTNTKTYCYYIKSLSYYADTTILHPLVDSSEEICSAPKDTIAPCPPKLAVSAQCNTFQDSLIWNNPDHTCPAIKNTVEYYNIYYTAVQGNDMILIKTINNVNDTIFVNDSLQSVAGCYAVTAVDSFGNESKLVPGCVDNCPQYTLPNVFTPNGDNQNDFFTPILPYRYIKSIDINIFNRWGQVMFHTNDPMINWDGRDQTTHGLCPDGVYYYICVVNEIRVTGVQPITLKGFVQLIR